MSDNYLFTIDFNNDQGTYTNISSIINKYGLPNTIIEIGVFEGRTTVWMAEVIGELNKNLKIYAIDPHSESADLAQNIPDAGKTFKKNIDACPYKNIEYINCGTEAYALAS